LLLLFLHWLKLGYPGDSAGFQHTDGGLIVAESAVSGRCTGPTALRQTRCKILAAFV